MKIYMLLLVIFLNFNVQAEDDMYSSKFILQPTYMNIDIGAPVYLGKIVFDVRFTSKSNFCGIYVSNNRIAECKIGTRSFGAEIGIFLKNKIFFDIIKSNTVESVQKNRSLEILNLTAPDALIFLGYFAVPLGSHAGVWRFYENPQKFTDPHSKIETFQLNVSAEDLRKL